MRSIRYLIVTGVALVALTVSLGTSANPQPVANDSSGLASAAQSGVRDARLVVAQQLKPQALTGVAHATVVTTNPAALARLETQKAILNAQGVTSLSKLGTLTISGTVVPQPGFVRAAFVRNLSPRPLASAPRELSGKLAPQQTPQTAPSAQTAAEAAPLKPSNLTTAATIVQGARGLKAAVISGRGGNAANPVPAVKIMGEPFAAPAQGAGPSGANKILTTIPLYTAYWVGNSIDFPDNTTIVIQPNVRFLVIIANSITVGSNVTLTYEDVPVMNPPAIPGKPSAVPAKPATPGSFSDGTPGTQGYPGTQPPQIGTPPDAPQVELWTLSLSQMPTVILKGQHGYQGVQGGGGGDGGQGGNGSDNDSTRFICHSGPGSGGNGGKGGNGANGGKGGNGGTGGIWSLYAPTTFSSMTIDVSGGERGEGGNPGLGGNGGSGGSRGAIYKFCGNTNWSAHGRHDGVAGPAGDPGIKGPDGVAGTMLANSINQNVIDANDFNNKLNDPAIQFVHPEYPNTATVGSTITIDGLNFTPTDTVTINGVPAPVTYVSPPTMLTATVPNTWGGLAEVKVVRAGNASASNTGTLYIKPVIQSTVPPSPSSPLRPNDTVIVNGTGFSHQMAVRVNHEGIANVTATSSTKLSFVMKRPASIPHDPANSGGEPAILSVATSGPIIESDSIPIVIATFQMFVIGDSVVWGEGLQQPDKFHSLVEAYEIAMHPEISVYKTVKAHTGATLSWNAPLGGTEHDGDIPQEYPSIQQQANALVSLPNAATADLILVTGCANDVDFKHFIDPLATHGSIAGYVSRYCLADMTSFLTSLANQFPAAKIVVAGYYQGLSMDSAPTYFVSLAGVYYGMSDNQGLAPDLLAAAVGISPASQAIVSDHAAYFAEQANMQLAAAVAAANASLASPRLYFANPGFGPTNAANASDAWVFGLKVPLGPTDSHTALTRREGVCSGVYDTSSFDYKFCRLASTGHPNEKGAAKYFEAIKPFL
jgi:hypothetical protein